MSLYPHGLISAQASYDAGASSGAIAWQPSQHILMTYVYAAIPILITVKSSRMPQRRWVLLALQRQAGLRIQLFDNTVTQRGSSSLLLLSVDKLVSYVVGTSAVVFSQVGVTTRLHNIATAGDGSAASSKISVSAFGGTHQHVSYLRTHSYTTYTSHLHYAHCRSIVIRCHGTHTCA